MERRILFLLRGYVRILICGNSCERFLNMCAFHGIRMMECIPSGCNFEANLALNDFRKLRPIIKKSHVHVRILERHGLPFFMNRNRKRKGILTGIAAALLILYWLSVHIWNINIEGNVSLTEDVIIEYLEQSGIVHGMKKKKIDCKELAANIRNYFSDVSWVSVQMKGTRLMIQVKEGILETDFIQEEPCSLVASESGTIVSVFVRQGIPMIKTGDEVEPGTLLVSGAIPVYNDSNEIVSYQYVRADADIQIRRSILYEDSVDYKKTEHCYTDAEKTYWQFQIGSKLFAMPNFFTDVQSCDIVTELRQLKLMKHFYLPLYIRKCTVRPYKEIEEQRTKTEMEQMLLSNLEYFMKKLEEKGLQIFENDVKIEWNERTANASGAIVIGDSSYRAAAVGRIEEELLKHEYG